ncbi:MULTISPECIES: ABC transporter permease [Virgibacillus]|uniref:Bacterial ABC transporter protein EcsB n=1 Tax=Virgibacillus dokdonensis TaxID=302167 RepID=A0A2K9J803_9BACI|nr:MULTISPECIES: ABC transporter permease [Virgibacillus]AUJ25730.1 Bacterial ABC transporter protein EcsB [Virgibacillus dokdonensis]NWO13933.1 ABC transporter permease [Virgibacillus sp.]
MFNSHHFFKERFSAHLKETSRYLRYIFNGHIAIAMLFFISALAVYYQKWLQEIPDDFPAAWVISIVFGLIASYSPVRTLLKEPDLVFLIPAEQKMKAYFRNAIAYSFTIQLYLVFLAAAALGPLYTTVFANRAGVVYLITIALLLVFKFANLIANWWMLKVRERDSRLIDTVVRTVLNIAVFYFFISGSMLLAGITTLLFAIVFLYDYQIASKRPGLLWDLLVEKDQSRMQAFYRLANMFADVPHLKSRVKKRHWLVRIVSIVPFTRTATYDYLYRITLIRSGDYLGMYVRLVVIGGVLIYVIPPLWLKIIFALLFLYLSSFQMMTLYQHHRTILWLDLYPVSLQIRQQSLLKLLLQLSIVQVILFTAVFIVMDIYIGAMITFAGGIIFSWLFVDGYVKRKLT